MKVRNRLIGRAWLRAWVQRAALIAGAMSQYFNWRAHLRCCWKNHRWNLPRTGRPRRRNSQSINWPTVSFNDLSTVYTCYRTRTLSVFQDSGAPMPQLIRLLQELEGLGLDDISMPSLIARAIWGLFARIFKNLLATPRPYMMHIFLGSGTFRVRFSSWIFVSQKLHIYCSIHTNTHQYSPREIINILIGVLHHFVAYAATHHTNWLDGERICEKMRTVFPDSWSLASKVWSLIFDLVQFQILPPLLDLHPEFIGMAIQVCKAIENRLFFSSIIRKMRRIRISQAGANNFIYVPQRRKRPAQQYALEDEDWFLVYRDVTLCPLANDQ